MRVLFLGPNGAGKGTQGSRLADRYNVPHIATGDLLRFAVEWGTDIGLLAKDYMARGELVPDEVVLELLRTRLSQPDAREGFVLDGFPRNPAQADALQETLEEIGQKVDVVVSLDVPDELLVERLSSRASCPSCGTTYALVDGKPERCAKDNMKLFRRPDDEPEVIRRRLQIFHEQTRPLIAYYENLGVIVHVHGVGDVDEVEKRLIGSIERFLQDGEPVR